MRASLLLLAAGCTASSGTTDSTSVGDTAGTTDSDSGGDDVDPLFFPPPTFAASAHFTVPTDRGLKWERDEAFLLADYTVPQLWITADGGYALMATNMLADGGRWLLTSPDGLEWTPSAAPLLTAADFLPLDCGERLEDGAMLYEADGSYRLIVEGTEPIEGDKHAAWRTWCQATSTDGLSFTPDTSSFFFTGAEDDGGQISVPSLLPLADGSQLVAYVGGLYTDAEGIRLARAAGDPWALGRVSAAQMFPDDDVDPDPVYLEGGGVRVYHTHTKQGGAGYGDLRSNYVPEQDVQLIPHTEPGCASAPGDCLLDPAFVRLDDGRMVLYYTRLVADGMGWVTAGIGRAFATD